MAILKTPLETKKLKLKNRLIMPPMATAKCDPLGKMTNEILEYYDEKSRGGYFSLVIVEHSYINPQGRLRERQLSLSSDESIEGFEKLAEILHKNNVLACTQINHAGSTADDIGLPFLGPSAVTHPNKDQMPIEMTKEHIESVVNDFRLAAGRAKKAGFDAVEIHSAHGYLLNQFYSPMTNKRNDEYGGSVLNRIKIHLEVIKAIKDEVGSDFPILLRLGGCDYQNGGSTIEDAVFASKEFEKAGIDILDISGGMCRYINPASDRPGYFSDMTEAIKKEISIPVILTGGITKLSQAEEFLKAGSADLIGVGRAVLNDSLWAENEMNSL